MINLLNFLGAIYFETFVLYSNYIRFFSHYEIHVFEVFEKKNLENDSSSLKNNYFYLVSWRASNTIMRRMLISRIF